MARLPLAPACAGFADRPVGEHVAAWSRLAPRAQARRAARAVYRLEAPWEDVRLARPLRAELAATRPAVALPAVRARSRSADGAEKALLDLGPTGAVEAVLLPEARSRRSRRRMQELAPAARRPLARRPDRASACLSMQVGCAVGCAFCASGRDGLVRNLPAGAIVAQALLLRRTAAARGLHLGSLVLMGMGEPFHNLDAVQLALTNLTHPDGAGFGANRVTVSTVGVAAGIERLAREGPAVCLTLSLHAPDDPTRAEVVPLARRLPPVADLVALLADYARRTRRPVTVAYTLLGGVNDAPAQARDLARLLRPRGPIHVNLIPWNAVPDLPYAAPTRARVAAFHAALRAAGLPAHVRRRRGAEAEAACGQLRIRTGPD